MEKLYEQAKNNPQVVAFPGADDPKMLQAVRVSSHTRQKNRKAVPTVIISHGFPGYTTSNDLITIAKWAHNPAIADQYH